MLKPRLEFWTVYEEAEPWAAFAYGHVDRHQFTRDDVVAAAHQFYGDEFDDQIPEDLTFEHLFMSQWYGDEGDDPDDAPNEESPWRWCEAGDKGAEPVTAVKLGGRHG